MGKYSVHSLNIPIFTLSKTTTKTQTMYAVITINSKKATAGQIFAANFFQDGDQVNESEFVFPTETAVAKSFCHSLENARVDFSFILE